MSRQADLPSFSIIMPTYQRCAVVCDAVRALKNVSYPGGVEVIVVVDGSTDGTAAALASLECPFHYRIIEQPNAGPGQARNRGAAAATGEILLFLDDDMICEPDILQQHAATHRAGADAVLGHVKLCKDSPAGFLSDGIEAWAAGVFEEVSQHGPASPFEVFTGHLSVRRGVFQELGGFDEAFTSGDEFGNEDADFGVRLLAHHAVRFNANAITYHRYVVTPRQNLQKAFRAARADARFARKHPHLAHEVFRLNGAELRITRYLYRPLSHVPLLGLSLVWFAGLLARMVLASPWRSSRTFARFFYAARSIAYWTALRSAGLAHPRNNVLILCYHVADRFLSDPVFGQYITSSDILARQIRSLRKRRFNFISPDDLLAFLKDGLELPRKAVLLTFDDCYAELHEAVRTSLYPHDIKSIGMAVSDMGTGSNEWDQAIGSAKMALLDTRGLKEIAGLGCEVGCHSSSHPDMTGLSDAELRAETSGAADSLENRGILRPRFFAYPYNARDRRSIAAVRNAGFNAAFGSLDRRATRWSNWFDLPRVSIDARHTGWRFWARTNWPQLTGRL